MSPSNILLLFTDQQRYDTIAALGNPWIKTPALDRMAREGTSFARCYTSSPVCVAARTALATGLPPHTTGVTDNMAMPQEPPSFMERLRDAGYQTHGVGKMHFTPDPYRLWGFESRDVSEELMEPDDFRTYLDQHGFGHVHDIHGVRSEYYYLPQPSQLPASLHNTTWVADRSIDFLKRRDSKRPFFLWASFIKPHPPFENPVPWNKLYRAAEMPAPFRPEGFERLLTYWNRFQNRYKYRDAGSDLNLLRTMRAAYYACISLIDYNIGRILAALGDEVERTLIVFTSDHGELLGDYGSFGKRCMLDAAARIPLLLRWPMGYRPERVMPGESCNTPASLLDLWPTFLSAAGISEAHIHPEGEDLHQIANAPEQARLVFSQFSHGCRGLYLATDGGWKYTYSAADEQEWLFDLRADAGETRNLAENPAFALQTRVMRQALLKRFQATGYAEAVEAGSWRIYGKSTLPDNPDWGLLFQDMPKMQPAIDALGKYARKVDFQNNLPL
jgi:arylsulfatase